MTLNWCLIGPHDIYIYIEKILSSDYKGHDNHNVWLPTIIRAPQLFERIEFFHVNKPCKIECCGNKTHQNVQNRIMTQGLELKTKSVVKDIYLRSASFI